MSITAVTEARLIMTRLGVLELCVAGAKQGVETTVRTVVDLAKQAEQAGLSRIWFTEHHGPTIPVSTPDLLIPVVGAETSTIRVGLAGVLVRLHSPFITAERFSLLSRMLEDRVDLGIAAGGTDAAIEEAMVGANEVNSPAAYEEQVNRLVAYLQGELEPRPMPEPGKLQIWMLGAATGGSRIAKKLSLPYCHSNFLGDSPSPVPDNSSALAVAGVCAPTKHEAERLVAENDAVKIRATVIGTPRDCAEQIRKLGNDHCVDEVMFMDLCVDRNAHIESYMLLAEVMKMVG